MTRLEPRLVNFESRTDMNSDIRQPPLLKDGMVRTFYYASKTSTVR